MKPSVEIFNTRFDLAEKLALDIIGKIKKQAADRRAFSIALSGGTTPRLLFTVLGDHFGSSVSWKNVHIFWVDERCVPPEDTESNYGMTKAVLLDKIKIPDRNVHRIKGENDPANEALRYAAVMKGVAETEEGYTFPDIVLLGVGEDGHVASIFPGNENLFNTDVPCHVTRHPETGQNRITISGKVINNARNIFFMVTGESKAEIIRSIFEDETNSKPVPASFVRPAEGTAVWYIDREAASLLPSGTVGLKIL
ncbi:MAG: 6-phosphogluconolactonase [Bacteroidales bacterium]|nr:6-phosphogluconolactonase [Bacteroidales bacterium]